MTRIPPPDHAPTPLLRRVLVETPVGPLTLIASAKGLREVRFGLPGASEAGVSGETRVVREGGVASEAGGGGERGGAGASGSAGTATDPAIAHLDAAEAAISRALDAGVTADRDAGSPNEDPSHHPNSIPDPIYDLSGHTPFRRAVWEALLRIPRGEARSYGEITAEIGQGSARAVGQAVGANLIPILIPCHRVIAGDGRLGGFSGGLDRKVALLRIEGIRAEGARFEARLGDTDELELGL